MITLKALTIGLLICIVSLHTIFLPFQVNENASNQTDENDVFLSNNEIPQLLNNAWLTENVGQHEDSDVRFTYSSQAYSADFFDFGYQAYLRGIDNSSSVVEVNFIGANPTVPEGVSVLPHWTNSFIGDDPSMWHSNIRNFDKIIYPDIYDNIDLEFYINVYGLKYDFIVKPGGNPSQICIEYTGANSIGLDEIGRLHISTIGQEIIEERPYSYQIIGGVETEILSSFVISKNLVRFSILNYNQNIPLIIDPMIFSTYLGGHSEEFANDMVMDDNRCVYITGRTSSWNYPTTIGGYQRTYNDEFDVFVAKFENDGSKLLYSTFIGGNMSDEAKGIALNSNNQVCVVGETRSGNFPVTSGSFDNTLNGSSDAFICVLDNNGSTLLHSTFFGGNSDDIGEGVKFIDDSTVVVGGNTVSTDIPTSSGCFDDTYNDDYDGFVFSYNIDESKLLYSTYLGGSKEDMIEEIAINANGNAYVIGKTKSMDFPTTEGCIDDTNGDYWHDVFVSKLSLNGRGAFPKTRSFIVQNWPIF